jgi:Leucine carboxyl methyltransferase
MDEETTVALHDHDDDNGAAADDGSAPLPSLQPLAAAADEQHQQQRKRVVLQMACNDVRAKAATIRAGHYSDPYVDTFASASQHAVQVIIKRGTYARIHCMDAAVSGFLTISEAAAAAEYDSSAAPTAQVVLLGSGLDTTYFRLLDNSNSTNNLRHRQQATELSPNNKDSPSIQLCWFEVDHDELFRGKGGRDGGIQQSQVLRVAAVSQHHRHHPLFPAPFIGWMLLQRHQNQNQQNLQRTVKQAATGLPTTCSLIRTGCWSDWWRTAASMWRHPP